MPPPSPPKNWNESKHRASYTFAEERAVVQHLLKRGGYSQRGGTLLWRQMESQGVCPGRSWQSLKGRFDKHILPNLGRFGVSRTHLAEADDKAKTAPPEVLGEEGNKREARMSYTKAEDLAILGFIADNRRFGDVGGVEMWKLMEEREVVVGRSWQSMKERFRKKIVNNIKSYNLNKEQLKGFTAVGGKEKQKRMGAQASNSKD